MLHDPNDLLTAEGQLEHKALEENQPPVRRPGDNYVLFGAVSGIVVGTVIGLNIGNPFFFVPAGFIIGGVAGVGVGSLIKYVVMRHSLRH